MLLQPAVPASEAVSAPVLELPGATISGKSVPDNQGANQSKRIPTVFAPFHAGVKFPIAGVQAPPGVTLSFSNVTLLLPNVTYEGIYQSGFLDFFELGQSARICFTNRYALLE